MNNRDEVIFHCPDDESAFWNHYFDLGTDYGAYIRAVDPAGVQRGEHRGQSGYGLLRKDQISRQAVGAVLSVFRKQI